MMVLYTDWLELVARIFSYWRYTVELHEKVNLVTRKQRKRDYAYGSYKYSFLRGWKRNMYGRFPLTDVREKWKSKTSKLLLSTLNKIRSLEFWCWFIFNSLVCTIFNQWIMCFNSFKDFSCIRHKPVDHLQRNLTVQILNKLITSLLSFTLDQGA